MGGYDIFKTTKNNKGEWNTPENIGYPINSVYDDIFFVLTADAKKGYFTTTNNNGSNDKDIFVIDFSTEEVKKQKDILAFLNGMITDNQSRIINNAQIIIKDKETNEVIQSINSDNNNGKYSVYLPMNKEFCVDIKKNGYLLFTKEIVMTDSINKLDAKLKIGIPDTVATSPIITQKLYFDFDKYVLKKESEKEAMRIFNMLNKHKNLIVEIAGNTDSIGSFEYNKKLSEKRAKYIVNKLVKLGISADRLHNIGYSFTKPVADNKEAEGRAKNRRVYVKVIDNKIIEEDKLADK
jgi:outer membrane protein OmpA-like peptidoglycan-associated protein